MGSGKWDVLISCPSFPNRSYIIALGRSGIRPGVKLPDGRKIYLVPDDLTLPTLNNHLKPFFDAGPLKLDGSGCAMASLNVSSLPKLGIPIWIAVIVMDAQAPNGIAYIPDTYVMRLP